MIRGIYTAASGMKVEALRQETIANNMANSETPGFKKDLALQRSLTVSGLVRKDGQGMPDKQLGRMEWGALIEGIYTANEQGLMQETGKALDLAIVGDGYFAVETPQGERLTRSGSFILDAERYLVTEAGHRVLGVNGPIRLPDGEVHIDEHGVLTVGEETVGQLRLVNVADRQALRKEGGSLFAAEENTQEVPFAAQIRQGFIEGSNVEVLEEMINMMAALRAYETNQRVVQAQDELLAKAVNEVGSLR